jgi:hypothetical protein
LEEREIEEVFTNLTDWNSFVRLIQIRFGNPAKDPFYLEIQPENPSPPSCKDPKPTPTQMTTPITIPTVAEPHTSHQPRLVAAPSPNTHNTINPHKIPPPPLSKIPAKTQTKDTSWPKPKAQPPPSPQTYTFPLSSHPKIPPSLPINKSNYHPQYQPPKTQSPATLFKIPSIPHHPYLKTTHCQPQNKRAKPKKPPPLLKSNLFHIDWFRRRKKAKYKPSKLVGRKDTRWDSETQGKLAEFLAV